ncbi:MAG: HAD family hydrolase, partial [Minisyncoccota bacterium]
QDAPLEIKEKWDPDHKKRLIIVNLLNEKISDLGIHIGGTTSIDITKKGEGKDFGIREFSKHIGTPIENMVYIGDALYPGGNDEPAKATGVDCIQVKDVQETKSVIREIIAS